MDPMEDIEAFMAASPITNKGAVLFKVDNGVGVVTLNQPENNNAMSTALFVGLIRCIKYGYDNVGEVRVIFIKSAGRIWRAPARAGGRRCVARARPRRGPPPAGAPVATRRTSRPPRR